MMLSSWPTWRRLAFTTALYLAVALTITVLVQGFAPSGPLRVLEVLGLVLTGAAVAGIVIGLIVARLANYQDPESEAEFERFAVLQQQVASVGSQHDGDDAGDREAKKRFEETVARLKGANIGAHRGRRLERKDL